MLTEVSKCRSNACRWILVIPWSSDINWCIYQTEYTYCICTKHAMKADLKSFTKSLTQVSQLHRWFKAKKDSHFFLVKKFSPYFEEKKNPLDLCLRAKILQTFQHFLYRIGFSEGFCLYEKCVRFLDRIVHTAPAITSCAWVEMKMISASKERFVESVSMNHSTFI